MLKAIYYEALRTAFRTFAWIRYNRICAAPILPDEIIEVDPRAIEDKTLDKPKISRLINAAVADGPWDLAVEKVESDVVFRSFVRHFVDGKDWEDTEYFGFLQGDVSEHGKKSDAEIVLRCQKLDALFAFIRDHGFRTQRNLEAESDIVIGSWKQQLIPPEFREVSINIARDGTLLWHGGFHRLCVANILELTRIPVRVAVRHAKWQQIRERVARGREVPSRYQGHPDIENIVSGNRLRTAETEDDR